MKFHNSRPRRKPTIRWEDVTGGTHQILGIQGWKRQAEDSRKEVSAEGGQGPEGAVAPRWNGMESIHCENK